MVWQIKSQQKSFSVSLYTLLFPHVLPRRRQRFELLFRNVVWGSELQFGLHYVRGTGGSYSVIPAHEATSFRHDGLGSQEGFILGDFTVIVIIEHFDCNSSLDGSDVVGVSDKLEGIVEETGHFIPVEFARVVLIITTESIAECFLKYLLFYLCKHIIIQSNIRSLSYYIDNSDRCRPTTTSKYAIHNEDHGDCGPPRAEGLTGRGQQVLRVQSLWTGQVHRVLRPPKILRFRHPQELHDHPVAGRLPASPPREEVPGQ